MKIFSPSKNKKKMKKEDSKKNLLHPTQQFIKRSTSLKQIITDNLPNEKRTDRKKQMLTLSKMSGIQNLEENNRLRASSYNRPTILISKNSDGTGAFKEQITDEEKKKFILENANLKKDIYKLEIELKKLEYENNKLKEEVQHQKNELEANEIRISKITMYCDKVNKLYYDMKDNYNKIKKQTELSQSGTLSPVKKSDPSLTHLSIDKLKRSDSGGVHGISEKKTKSPRTMKENLLEQVRSKNQPTKKFFIKKPKSFQ